MPSNTSTGPDTPNTATPADGQSGVSTQDVDTAKSHEFKDADGNVVDAPVIASFERELSDARDSADTYAIDEVTERYYEARKQRQNTLNKSEKARRKGNN